MMGGAAGGMGARVANRDLMARVYGGVRPLILECTFWWIFPLCSTQAVL